MKVSVGWNVVVRLRQDPDKLYKGVIRGFIPMGGKRVEEWDLMTKKKTLCLARVQFHSDDERGLHIGGSIAEGFDEVYPISPPEETEVQAPTLPRKSTSIFTLSKPKD